MRKMSALTTESSNTDKSEIVNTTHCSSPRGFSGCSSSYLPSPSLLRPNLGAVYWFHHWPRRATAEYAARRRSSELSAAAVLLSDSLGGGFESF